MNGCRLSLDGALIRPLDFWESATAWVSAASHSSRLRSASASSAAICPFLALTCPRSVLPRVMACILVAAAVSSSARCFASAVSRLRSRSASFASRSGEALALSIVPLHAATLPAAGCPFHSNDVGEAIESIGEASTAGLELQCDGAGAWSCCRCCHGQCHGVGVGVGAGAATGWCCVCCHGQRHGAGAGAATGRCCDGCQVDCPLSSPS